MIEIDFLLIFIILLCLGLAIVIVDAWRRIVFFLVQFTAVLIACSGLLLLILSVFWPELPMMQASADILKEVFDTLPTATARLLGVLLFFAGVPLAALFRGLCFRLMPWLEVFTYPWAMREAFLETGIQPPPSESGEDREWRFVLPHGLAIVYSIVVLAPLFLLSRYGVPYAEWLLEAGSNLGLVLFISAFVLLRRDGTSNGH